MHKFCIFQNSNLKKDTRTASASQQDATGVEGLVAVEAYGAADGMGAVRMRCVEEWR